ncbi:MAG: hypothetical protein Q7J73_04235 [Dehalococcoidales bacterium]|nr:hypothetical protein [Dehalococcoidales bacterium]
MMKSIALLVIAILVINVVVISVSLMQQTSKLNKASANVLALEREVATLTGDIATLRSNISSLQVNLTESEAKAVTLQTALSKTNADLVKALTNANNQPAINITQQLPVLIAGDHGAGMGQ